MNTIIQFTIDHNFSIVFIPIFTILMIGHPKFLIKIVSAVLEIRENWKGFKIFDIIKLILIINAIFYNVNSYFLKLKAEQVFDEIYSQRKILSDNFFFDEILREANFYEKNAYKLYTYTMLILIFEVFCNLYITKWKIKIVDQENSQNNKIKKD